LIFPRSHTTPQDYCNTHTHTHTHTQANWTGVTFLCAVLLCVCVCVCERVREHSVAVCTLTGPSVGQALSRQRLSKWIAETIQQAYRHSGSPAPQQVRAHSTRSVAASWASLRGVPLSDICRAASWASGCTFTRFYRVNVVSHNPVAAAILPTPLWHL